MQMPEVSVVPVRWEDVPEQAQIELLRQQVMQLTRNQDRLIEVVNGISAYLNMRAQIESTKQDIVCH